LRELAVASQQFAGELEPPLEIECGEAVDEQWIVPVVGLPNN